MRGGSDQARDGDPDTVDLGDGVRSDRRAAIDRQLEVERPRAGDFVPGIPSIHVYIRIRFGRRCRVVSDHDERQDDVQSARAGGQGQHRRLLPGHIDGRELAVRPRRGAAAGPVLTVLVGHDRGKRHELGRPGTLQVVHDRDRQGQAGRIRVGAVDRHRVAVDRLRQADGIAAMPWHIEGTGQEEVEALEAAGGATEDERGRQQADQPGATAQSEPPGSRRLPGAQREVDPLVESIEDAFLRLDLEEREEVGLEPVTRGGCAGASVSGRHGRTP